MFRIQQHVSLKPFNTFGMDVPAEYLAEAESVEGLIALLEESDLSTKPLTVLGGGSNILFTGPVSGWVFRNTLSGKEVIRETDAHYYVRAGAGESWHDFVLWCLERDMFGVENLSLIPGNVGAAPMQNIGAYGVELKAVFHELEAVEIQSGQRVTFSADDCAFGYRTSVFKTSLKGQFIITSVVFRLNKEPHLNTSYGAIERELERMEVGSPTPKDVSLAVIHIRQSKLPDPAEIGNAGSFFKNPVVSEALHDQLVQEYPEMPAYPAGSGHIKLAAGWLIEQAGWKGFTRGAYGVHKKQALVLVNYGGASGSDIYALSEEIKVDVEKKFGVSLEREVNIF